MREEVNLTRPCDACGHFIGGACKRCSKCGIYLCMMCRITLAKIANEFPAKYPMCGGELE